MKRLMILLLLAISLFAKVDINKASLKELQSLKGIGMSKAMAIVSFRKMHKFKSIEDITKVKGIGKKLFAKIKDQVEVKK